MIAKQHRLQQLLSYQYEISLGLELKDSSASGPIALSTDAAMNTVPITKKLIAFGSKEIYLYVRTVHPTMASLTVCPSPKFTVALVRTPDASPYHARFHVPLDFSKYDLRDYLYHAYKVKAFNIRSFVKQMPVRDTAARPRTWFRPESKKYMTIEMERPFVWPATPKDLKPWGGIDEDKKGNAVAKMSGQPEKDEQRDAARKLRTQVEKLFTKEDEKVVDDGNEPKKKQNRPLSAKEKEKEEEQLGRIRKLKKMTTLELWEERRTGKIVQGDDRSLYHIKA